MRYSALYLQNMVFEHLLNLFSKVLGQRTPERNAESEKSSVVTADQQLLSLKYHPCYKHYQTLMTTLNDEGGDQSECHDILDDLWKCILGIETGRNAFPNLGDEASQSVG